MEPVGRKLNPEEEAVLTVLSQEDRADEARTIEVIATSLERDPVDVGGVLVRLERDGLVSRHEDDAGEESWRRVSSK